VRKAAQEKNAASDPEQVRHLFGQTAKSIAQAIEKAKHQ